MKRVPTGFLTPLPKVEGVDKAAPGLGQSPMNITVGIPAPLALEELPTRVRAAVAEDSAYLAGIDLSLHLTGLKVPTAALTEMTGTLFSWDHPSVCSAQGAHCVSTCSSTDPLWGKQPLPGGREHNRRGN